MEEEGKIRRAFAVETGSKIVVVWAWCAAWSQICRADEDQFASATKTLGRGDVLLKSVVARCLVVVSGIVSRIDMSAIARARSLLVLLMATYCAVREEPGSVSIPDTDMPSSWSWAIAARPLRSSPTALWRRTEEPSRCDALAMLCATPPRVCVITAGLDVCGSGSVLLVEAERGA